VDCRGGFRFAELLEDLHETGQEWLAIVGVDYLHTLAAEGYVQPLCALRKLR